MPLKPKHQRFVTEYLKDSNATQAAIRMGYKPESANVVGPRLLVNVGIRAAIDAELAKATEAAGLTVQKVREGWRKVIDADVRKLFGPDGEPLTIPALGDNEAALLGGFEAGKAVNLDPTDGKRDPWKVLKYRLTDRAKYLEQAAKHLGMFTEKVEVTGSADLLATLLEGRKRAAGARG